MKFQEQQPNMSGTQNLESAKSAALLTQNELSEFKKLPREEQKRHQRERLLKLEELQNKFRIAVEEATKTGKVEEAQKLKIAFDKDAEELKQLIGIQEISVGYKYKDEKGRKKEETITIDIEKEVADYSAFYKERGIKLPDNFAKQMKEIWQKHEKGITKEIKEKGFNMVLLIPNDLPRLKELDEKMTADYEKEKGKKTLWGTEISPIVEIRNNARIVLVHDAPGLALQSELRKTLGKIYHGEKEDGKDNKAEDFRKQGEKMTLSEYLILQRIIFEKTGIHIDGNKSSSDKHINSTWLPGSTMKRHRNIGGTFTYFAYWNPDYGHLYFGGFSSYVSNNDHGCRLSRSFS